MQDADELDSAVSRIALRYRSRVMDGQLHKTARLEALATGLLLADVLDVTHSEQLKILSEGKPVLGQDSASIGISHGGDLAVLAVADGAQGQIGVDVERIEFWGSAVLTGDISASPTLPLFS